MSIWQTLYTHLEKEGFDVYSPGQHIGECLSKYVVLKDTGATQLAGLSTNRHYYDVLCYVPLDEFSSLETFVDEVKESMKKLFPLVKPTGVQTPSFLDDSLKAHMVSVQYSNNRKFTYN